MTNINVVATDSRTSLDISITVALSSPAIFQASSSKTMPPTTYLAIKKMKKADGSLVETWLNSLRAASPTRTINAMPRKREDPLPIIHGRPSALDMFEDIVRDSEGKQIAIFLDYDGTLSPIVQEPDKAYISNEMREVVRDIARYFPTAIVTGRCRDKVYNFVRLGGLFYAGSHGMDIKGPSRTCDHKRVVIQPAREFIPMINEVQKELGERTKSIRGCKVENNKFCLSVHFRGVDERMWAVLTEQVLSVLSKYPKLKLSPGRKVLEIRPAIKWDKGKAVEFLLESLGFGDFEHVLPIYIGDDRTDEDAFKVLKDRRQGVGILVSDVPKETSASYSLKEPNEVKEFLKRLVEWRRM